MRIIITTTVQNTEHKIMFMQQTFTSKADGHWEM